MCRDVASPQGVLSAELCVELAASLEEALEAQEDMQLERLAMGCDAALWRASGTSVSAGADWDALKAASRQLKEVSDPRSLAETHEQTV